MKMIVNYNDIKTNGEKDTSVSNDQMEIINDDIKMKRIKTKLNSKSQLLAFQRGLRFCHM